MARIRTVKPDFWTDETVGECSPTARLLFIGIWSHADDYGSIDRSAKQLRAQVFPYDSFDCEPLIQELISVGLVVEYECDGKKYLHVPGFAEHQRIEKKSQAKFPLYNSSQNAPGVVGESSRSSNGSSLGREGNIDRAPAKKNPRGARICPDDWQPPENLLTGLREKYPQLDIEGELAMFRDHEFSQPKRDWGRALQNWMRKAKSFKPPPEKKPWE